MFKTNVFHPENSQFRKITTGQFMFLDSKITFSLVNDQVRHFYLSTACLTLTTGQVLVVGIGPSSPVALYNVTANSWTDLGYISLDCSYTSLIGLGQRVFLLSGGIVESSITVNEFFASNNTWLDFTHTIT